MAMSRQRWLTRLIPFVGFSIVAAAASQADAAVTSCETNALTNANFEAATVDGKAALWCDNWGRGYSRVLVTPAKYNYVSIVSIPLSVPAAERAAGAYQIVNINQTQAKNVFVGAMVKGSNIVLDPDGLGATLSVGFKVDCAAYPRFCESHSNPADSTLWCGTLPSAGTFNWRWVGLDSHTCGIGYVDTATGNWIDVPIKSVAVFPIIRGATGTAYFDLIQLMEFPPGPGAVTFMFDDGHQSAKATAKPILDKYRFVGSAAVNSSTIGSDTGPPCDVPPCIPSMTPEDLRNLQAAGWDIASHGVTGSSHMSGLSTADAETELQKSKSTLTALGLTIDTFTWPYGDYNQSLIGLAQAGLPTGVPPLYKSTRNTEFDDNAYGTFPYALKTLDVTDTTTLQDVQAWINDIKAGGRWGVFLLHDISDEEYGTPPTMLDQIAQLVASSGVAVINYRQGYKTFANIPVP